jgi:hypothetical protein
LEGRGPQEKEGEKKKKKKILCFIHNPGSSVGIDVILELTFCYYVRWLFIILTDFYSCSLKIQSLVFLHDLWYKYRSDGKTKKKT